MKRTVMTTAWEYLRQGLFANMAQALSAAWKAFKMKLALANGVVEFAFTKADGSLRQARGTTSSRYFDYDPKGGRTPKSDVIVFFDLDAEGFRSFRVERLIG